MKNTICPREHRLPTFFFLFSLSLALKMFVCYGNRLMLNELGSKGKHAIHRRSSVSTESFLSHSALRECEVNLQFTDWMFSRTLTRWHQVFFLGGLLANSQWTVFPSFFFYAHLIQCSLKWHPKKTNIQWRIKALEIVMWIWKQGCSGRSSETLKWNNSL